MSYKNTRKQTRLRNAAAGGAPIHSATELSEILDEKARRKALEAATNSATNDMATRQPGKREALGVKQQKKQDDKKTVYSGSVANRNVDRFSPVNHVYSFSTKQAEDTPPIFRLNIKRKETKTQLYDLANEVLLKVFVWLRKPDIASLRLTCRRFRILGTEESLWVRIDLVSKQLHLSHIHQLISYGLKIMRLSRATIHAAVDQENNGTLLSDQMSKQLILSTVSCRPQICNLRYLDMSMLITPDPRVVEGILRRCVHLVCLSVEFVELTHGSCKAIGRNHAITHLNMSMALKLDITGMDYILQGCQNLEEFNMAWCGLPSQAMSAVIRQLPTSLLRLNISGCRPDNGESSLSDADIAVLVQRCSQLVELDISDCSSLTAESCSLIAASLLPKPLRTLHMSRCYSVDAFSYCELGDLEELNIHSTLTAQGLEVVLPSLGKVKRLNQRHFSDIARPTTGIRRSSIWLQRTRDLDVAVNYANK